MRRTQSSVTAQGIAAVRAVESTKPADQRICYDPLARQFIHPIYYLLIKLFAGYGERKAPGTMAFLLARTRYIDDYLETSLENGIDQLVILGAGLDTRAYRYEQQLERVKVFEVDHPATQKEKCNKLLEVFGGLPQHVIYVPLDFNRETLGKLFDFDYQKVLKTLFIWEGVTHYLTSEAVDSTLKFIRDNSPPGSTLIFDYVFKSALLATRRSGEITRIQRYARFTGELLTFGIDDNQVVEFLSQRGFGGIRHVTSDDLKRLYFSGTNKERTISSHYGIVHAVVER